jgi:hypothetical protein
LLLMTRGFIIATRCLQAADELGFAAYEDLIPTTDMGYMQLCKALDVPIHAGEFIFSIYDYAEYVRRGAVDVLRFIVDNVGGITGGMKIAAMAECFGMECAPHNWGDTLDHAVHFHCELAMPNNVFFETRSRAPTARDEGPHPCGEGRLRLRAGEAGARLRDRPERAGQSDEAFGALRNRSTPVNRRDFLKSTLASAVPPGERPPNILVIMTDEHNPRVAGFHGNSLARTPHLDRLAERSPRTPP